MTRAESQERNRARILAAARAEFAERGFRDVKVDNIAERAGLTRGAVYSNFPGKRALFFSVLADSYRPDGPILGARPSGPTPGQRPDGPTPSERPGDPTPGERPDGRTPDERPDGAPSAAEDPGAPLPAEESRTGLDGMGTETALPGSGRGAARGGRGPGGPLPGEGPNATLSAERRSASPYGEERGTAQSTGASGATGGGVGAPPSDEAHGVSPSGAWSAGSHPSDAPHGGEVARVLGAVARAWLDDPVPAGAMAVWRELVPQVQAEEGSRLVFAELMTLYATLLGLAMERLDEHPGRRLVRPATAALTLLQGASQRSALAAHPVTRSRTVRTEREDVVRACERLARLDPGPAPLLPMLGLKPYSLDSPWAPPPAVDALRGMPLALDGDGLVVLLGLRRLSALEDVVRAAPAALPITLVAVTDDPGEHGPLARFALARMGAHLRAAVPAGAWPDVRILCDESGHVAAAAGSPSVHDATETAVRVSAGRLVRRADGRGAGYALASEYAGQAGASVTTGYTGPAEDAGLLGPVGQPETPENPAPSEPNGHTVKRTATAEGSPRYGHSASDTWR